MKDPKLITDIIKHVTTKYPLVILELILRENVAFLGGDYKTVVSDIISYIVKNHPDIIFDVINTFSERVVDIYINNPVPAAK